ncbi:MAG TPA: ABC transporter permease [bacterium]|nr:ABC transporter permease [bacterium]HPN36122.1 ABC transporter permease [bacterium]
MPRFLIYAAEGVKIAYEALRAYKLRSILTTLGIVIGVTTVITIVSLIQGLNRAFTSEISSLGTDTLYIGKWPWMMDGDDWLKFRNRPNVTIKEANEVRSASQLAQAVAPVMRTQRIIKYQGKSLERVAVVGTTEDYLLTANATPEEGRFLIPSDVDQNRAVVVIGSEVADKLFEKEDPIGKRVSIAGRKFRVIGILEKRGTMFDNNLDILAIMPIGAFQSVFGATRRRIEIQVKVVNPAMVEEAEYELTGIMRRVRGLPAIKENNFAINKQSMFLDMYNKLTRVLWAVAIGVGAISLLVGGIGIMNIMLVSVTERTREIGIRKAIGARKTDILWQFLIESMMICGLGVVIGIGLAVGLAKLVAATTPLPAAITLWVVFLGLAFVVGIGVFFGIYPASKAAKLNPIEALRYE